MITGANCFTSALGTSDDGHSPFSADGCERCYPTPKKGTTSVPFILSGSILHRTGANYGIMGTVGTLLGNVLRLAAEWVVGWVVRFKWDRHVTCRPYCTTQNAVMLS